MCGIIGYVGNKNAQDVLISGLKSLEYRGYDSSGIAFVYNKKVNIIKSEGKVSNLESKLNKNILTNIGIGHTRWATHGIPNEINAHPHKVGITTIVHNGIIENYVELKEDLSKCYSFKSETDTEVACALIDHLYSIEKDKLKALSKAKEIIKGSYAFAIIFDDELDTIYTIRKDSPLILAKCDNEYFLASDIAAILSYTNKYYLLEKDEYAKINFDGLFIYDKDFKIIEKQENVYKGDLNDIMKGGYDHFMLKEIHEESKVYENIINSYLPNYSIHDLEKNFGDFKNYESITIVGCGSAYHAGLAIKNLLEEYADIKIDVQMASEYRYKKIFSNPKELVILISQSGETADTLEALRIAKIHKMHTLGIINVLSSSIARESDSVIYSLAGCEIAVATTKAYLSQVTILTLLAILIGYQKGKISELDANNYLLNIKDAIKDTNEILNNTNKYLDIAKKIFEKREMFFIGRNTDFALCMEASLKMKEISYIHSESYAAGELKHGTISLIEDDTIVVGIMTIKELASKTISNLKETRARGSRIIVVTTEEIKNDYLQDKFYDELIVVPNLNPFFQSLTIMTTIQLLSYYVALLKGENIDKPRNLAKSVTVE